LILDLAGDLVILDLAGDLVILDLVFPGNQHDLRERKLQARQMYGKFEN